MYKNNEILFHRHQIGKNLEVHQYHQMLEKR